MNNKGFGIETVFIFIALVFLVFLSIYAFVNSIIYPILYPKKNHPNYTNEYRLYIREHNLNK